MSNVCLGCGREISDKEIFGIEYEHCRNHCCCCCPSKNGYKGEACQKDWIDRKNGRPVGFIESITIIP